jgi:uncharacterized protein (DUF1015 family)
MPTVLPFRAYRYNQKLIGDLRNVSSPPYDAITPEEQRALYNRHQSNAVRFILRSDVPGQDKYKMAGQDFDLLLRQNLITPDKEASFYLFEDTFRLGEKTYTRHGITHLLLLNTPGDQGLPTHSRTLKGPVVDRIRVLQAVNSNLSPILTLAEDPEKKLLDLIKSESEKRTPIINIQDYYDVQRRVFAVHEEAVIAQLEAILHEQKLMLADGHHRYEAALAYRDWRRHEEKITTPYGEEPYDYIMCGTVSFSDPGLIILPMHRVISNFDAEKLAALPERLREKFNVEELPHYSEMKTRLDNDVTLIGMATRDRRFFVLKLKEAIMEEKSNEGSIFFGLQVNQIRYLIMEDLLGIEEEAVRSENFITYCKGRSEVLSALQKEENSQVAFFLNTITPDIIGHFSRSQDLLPQRSAYFYPFLLAGTTFNKF